MAYSVLLSYVARIFNFQNVSTNTCHPYIDPYGSHASSRSKPQARLASLPSEQYRSVPPAQLECRHTLWSNYGWNNHRSLVNESFDLQSTYESAMVVLGPAGEFHLNFMLVNANVPISNLVYHRFKTLSGTYRGIGKRLILKKCSFPSSSMFALRLTQSCRGSVFTVGADVKSVNVPLVIPGSMHSAVKPLV